LGRQHRADRPEPGRRLPGTALLTADLERFRLRIVTAREEARRRLGSDLHDGLGHRLAGLVRKTETAANLLDHDPATARALLAELTQPTKAAIAEVRGLAHQLHPPELELLGLVEALRERAQGYAAANGDGLHISIEAPTAHCEASLR
jgi:signal transduction histidine kinase